MKKLFLLLLLGAATSYAQSPQIPLTGNVGPGGLFAFRNASPVTMTDANYTLAFPTTSAGFVKLTGTLTATRNVVEPFLTNQQCFENLTTGSQSVQIIGQTGTGVTIPNGQYACVQGDGTNYVTQSGSGGGAVFPGTNGVVVNTSPTTSRNATYSDVVGLWASGCSGYLKNDGTCATPSGAGPAGSTYDVQTNGGSSTFGGDGNFTYNPSGPNTFSMGQTVGYPGYNVGAGEGSYSTNWLISSYPAVFSAGVKTYHDIFGFLCEGAGDCNIQDMYWHYNGPGNDANGEGGVGFHNYPTIGETVYSAPIASSANSGTQLTFSSSINTWGNLRPVIVQESAQSITITGTAGGFGTAGEVTVTGATFTPSVTGTLGNSVTVSHGQNNPSTLATLTLNVTGSTGCAANDLISFIPSYSGQIQTARIVSATALSGGTQTITANIIYSRSSGDYWMCEGPQSQFMDIPSLDLNGNKLLYSVLGAINSSTLVVARMAAGTANWSYIRAGSATLYQGATLIDSRDPANNLQDGYGFTLLSDNNTTWTVGDHVEVDNGFYQLGAGYRSQVSSNNPTMEWEHFDIACPPNSAGCGNLYPNPGNNYSGRGIRWNNENSATNYASIGSGGRGWRQMPLNEINGYWGPLAIYQNIPTSTVMEFTATKGGGFYLWGADDGSFYQYLGQDSGGTNAYINTYADTVLYGSTHGTTLNFVLPVPNGTVVNCAGFTSTHQLVGTGSPCGSSSGGDTIISPNSTLTVGGTSSATTLDMNLAHANTWTGGQSFTDGATPASTVSIYNDTTDASGVGVYFTQNGTQIGGLINNSESSGMTFYSTVAPQLAICTDPTCANPDLEFEYAAGTPNQWRLEPNSSALVLGSTGTGLDINGVYFGSATSATGSYTSVSTGTSALNDTNGIELQIAASNVLSVVSTGFEMGTTAPTGSCSANGAWQLTRDGNITRCLSGTWTSFGGSSGISGSGTTNAIPKFTGTTAIGNSAITDNGTTVAITEPVTVSPTTGNPAVLALSSNSGTPTLQANEVNLIGANNSSMTAYGLQYPSTAPTNGQVLTAGTASGGITPMSWTTPSGATVASAEVVTFSATPTFSVSTNVSRIRLTGNITSFTLGAGSDGQSKTLCFAQGGASGGYTVTPPANVHGFFTIGTTSSGWNCQSFTYDSTDSIWLAANTGVINE